ncbi:hypothetical protein [Nocardia asiatica]|uniref:hypothetical protein n=1 Tax=Nocardia asiatica TaxID=209252 RepID=UPI00030D2783|nr:hypothetical protein [Nocardia asiatica]
MIPLTDERLRQLAYDDMVCTNDNERAMAAEVLSARTRIAELEAAQCPRVDARLINLDALPVGSMVVTDAGVSALKITEFAPGVTDDDGYRSEWATPAGTVGTYDLALPVIVLREIQEVQP